jgi:hypothetical protein
MQDWRWLGVVLGLTPVLTGGCGGGTDRGGGADRTLPSSTVDNTLASGPFSTVDNPLATECRFSLDGAEVKEDSTTVQPESEHDIAVEFRLKSPNALPDGVVCYVRILGKNLDGVLVTYGNFTRPIKPDPEGRIALGARLPIPAREGDYELQALIQERKEKERLLIANHAFLVQSEK